MAGNHTENFENFPTPIEKTSSLRESLVGMFETPEQQVDHVASILERANLKAVIQDGLISQQEQIVLSDVFKTLSPLELAYLKLTYSHWMEMWSDYGIRQIDAIGKKVFGQDLLDETALLTTEGVNPNENALQKMMRFYGKGADLKMEMPNGRVTTIKDLATEWLAHVTEIHHEYTSFKKEIATVTPGKVGIEK